jgi:hypothetical protein
MLLYSFAGLQHLPAPLYRSPLNILVLLNPPFNALAFLGTSLPTHFVL